jgi:hypothetical protein
MSTDTDAYEINPRDYEELAYSMDSRTFNGSTKLITGLLALMNVLAASAVVGGVIMYGKVEALDEKVNLIIEGRIQIRIPPQEWHDH